MVLLALAGPATVHAALVTLIDEPGGDYRVATITGVTIGGTAYDATFVHGVSFIGPPQIPIAFDTLATAQAAAAALITELNTAAIDPLNDVTDPRTISLAIPYWYPSSIPGTVVWLNNDCGNCGGIFGGSGPLVYAMGAPGTSNADGVIGPYNAFVRFTEAPEPSPLALLSLVGAAALLSRRRRQR